ncbi:hypothetical protein GCM10009613_38700 [Pseudonocardia kongjuensis]|uniref:DUF3558 domain-containing protein n=1 Tax=Pseudonocardia kongjuensis TaxID=102227 RepID=A0ABN1Y0H9_9PSEU
MACRTVGRALLTALVVLLAGCGPGEPAGPFPPRPADIDTATVDLCTALTAEQQDELGVDPGESWAEQHSDGPTRICGWSNFDDGYNYTVQTLPTPAAAAVGAPGSTVQPVEGYGSVRVTDHEESLPLCELYLDISDSAALRVQVQATARDENGRHVSSEQVCSRATTVSSQVLQNLRDAPA